MKLTPDDFAGEDVRPLSQLARLVPARSNRREHLDPRVLLRYVLVGEKVGNERVKLPAYRYGRGPWLSSVEKLRTFLDLIERRPEKPVIPESFRAKRQLRVPKWVEDMADRMGL